MATFHGTLQSEKLMRKVPFAAILPSELKKDEQQKPFRTLYLLHGWNDAYDSWIINTRIVELATKHNIAVIMPSGENSFYVDHKNGQQYGKYIGEELVQITRKMFNLSHNTKDTWIAGLSMGGYGALRNGLVYSDTFSKLAAFSSRILVKDDPYHDLKEEENIAVYTRYLIGSDSFADVPEDIDINGIIDNKQIFPDIYIACGTEDFLYQENKALHERLENKKIKHVYHESPGDHTWSFWDHYIEKAIEWMVQ